MSFKLPILLIACVFVLNLSAQEQHPKTEVLPLGVFHFNFPNLDIKKIAAADQIDVLTAAYQQQIDAVVKELALFKPNFIAIEREPSRQAHYDSLYQQYLLGKYTLGRNEEEQIGFRLAKMMGLRTLNCIDSWGDDYASLSKVLDGKDTVAYQHFMHFFYHNPDSAIQGSSVPVFKTEGIPAELKRLNDPQNLKKDLGYYLTGIFKYETDDNRFFGPDFVTGWWFNRNLRIFRNMQKIGAGPSDRILVIFGAGHMNLLDLFIDASPEYKLVRPSEYLK